MEKLKDFIYEKSDLFFAGLVVAAVVFVVSQSLGGWVNAEGEESKYAAMPAVAAGQTDDPTQDDEVQSDSETDDPIAPEPDDSSDAQEPSGADSSANTADAQQPSTPEPQAPAAPQESAKPSADQPAVKETISFTISSGSTAKSIADSLKAQGLISDAAGFLQSLAQSGKDTRLKAGTFVIPRGATPAEIINILTK